MWSDNGDIVDLDVWQAQAIQLFGEDPDQWKFQCPTCFLVQCRADFVALGLYQHQADTIAGYSCIRRWTDQECLASGNGPTLLRISEGEFRNTFVWAS